MDFDFPKEVYKENEIFKMSLIQQFKKM